MTLILPVRKGGAGVQAIEVRLPAALSLGAVLLAAGMAALWRLRPSSAFATALLLANCGVSAVVNTLFGVLLHALRSSQSRSEGRRLGEDPGPVSFTTSLALAGTGFVLGAWLLTSGYTLGNSRDQALRRSVQEASDLAAVLVSAAIQHPREELAAVVAALAPQPSPQAFVLVVDNDKREVRLPEGRPSGTWRLQLDLPGQGGDDYRCTLLPDSAPDPVIAAPGGNRGVPCVLRALPSPGGQLDNLQVAVALPPPPSPFGLDFALSLLGAALLFSGLGLYLGRATSLDAARDLSRLGEDLDRMDVERGAEGLLVPLSTSVTQEIGQLAQALAGLRSHLFDEVSRYEQALARAEDADRRKTEFIGDVGRELRAPLEEIQANARRLLDGDDGPLLERQREDVQIILQGAQHLLELLRDILDVSVLQGGLRLGKRGPVDVAALGRDLLRSLRPLVNEGRVQLRLQVQPGAPQALADGQAVRRILGNLLSNAVKLTSDGEIAVTLERWPTSDPGPGPDAARSGDRPEDQSLDRTLDLHPRHQRQDSSTSANEADDFLRVSVRDTGPGIARADQPKLFGEYIQLGTPFERARGTGLGLAIARRLCALHGGAIDVDSDLGQGAVFRFTLPAVPEPTTGKSRLPRGDAARVTAQEDR